MVKQFIRQCTNKKPVVDFTINETTMLESALPADFTFHEYRELKPVGCEQARVTRLWGPPVRSVGKKRLLTKSLWLNNNKLKSFKGLEHFCASVLERPILLTYLDLSFNHIEGIDEVIQKFCNLTVVHLHGNNISDIRETAKLHPLKKLRNLTFHGNPIAVLNIYRGIVAAYIPPLKHLDHTPILPSLRLEPIHPDALKYLKELKKYKWMPCMTEEEESALAHEAEEILHKEEMAEFSEDPIAKLQRQKNKKQYKSRKEDKDGAEKKDDGMVESEYDGGERVVKEKVHKRREKVHMKPLKVKMVMQPSDVCPCALKPCSQVEV